jgi:hypothetical protein
VYLAILILLGMPLVRILASANVAEHVLCFLEAVEVNNDVPFVPVCDMKAYGVVEVLLH